MSFSWDIVGFALIFARLLKQALEKLLEDAANAKPVSSQAMTRMHFPALDRSSALTDCGAITAEPASRAGGKCDHGHGVSIRPQPTNPPSCLSLGQLLRDCLCLFRSSDSVRAFPAQYQEVFEQSLREQDGIKQIVAILLEYHQDPQDAQQRGATLVGAAPELVDEVQRLLVRGNLESRLRVNSKARYSIPSARLILPDRLRVWLHLQKHFPSVGAEASAEDEDGSDDKPSTDASSPEAREAADKIKEFYLAFKTWPTQFQQLLKGMLNDDAKTWEQKVQDMVKHHAAPSSGHPADVRVLSGASEKLQAEIIEVLVASDFEDKLVRLWGLFAHVLNSSPLTCFV